MPGEPPQGCGGTAGPANPDRSLFLTVRTPRQAWLGKKLFGVHEQVSYSFFDIITPIALQTNMNETGNHFPANNTNQISTKSANRDSTTWPAPFWTFLGMAFNESQRFEKHAVFINKKHCQLSTSTCQIIGPIFVPIAWQMSTHFRERVSQAMKQTIDKLLTNRDNTMSWRGPGSLAREQSDLKRENVFAF